MQTMRRSANWETPALPNLPLPAILGVGGRSDLFGLLAFQAYPLGRYADLQGTGSKFHSRDRHRDFNAAIQSSLCIPGMRDL